MMRSGEEEVVIRGRGERIEGEGGTPEQGGGSSPQGGESFSHDGVSRSQDGASQDKMLENGFMYDKNTTKNLKKNERDVSKKIQKIRQKEHTLRKNLFGIEMEEVIENTVVVSLENRQSTKVQVQNSNIRHIYAVLEKHISSKDIKEIRLNKKKGRATLEIKTSVCCLPASKAFIERLELKEDIIVELGDQVSWDVKMIQRSAIGVIRGVPLNESVDDIKWHCEGKGIRVRAIRRLGPTVVSIQFDGSLPSHILFPFSYGNQATKVEPYSPGPKQCMKCFGFGHMAILCTGPLRCLQCGGENHIAANCQGRTPKCPNCGGQHAPLWKECPVNQEKKAQKNALIENRKKEEREIERLAFQGIFVNDFPDINSRRDNVLGQAEGGKGEKGTEPEKEIEVRILKKLEERLEERLITLEQHLDSMIDKIGERMLKMLESRLDENETITDSLPRGIDVVIEGKLEGMITRVFEKVYRQAPTRAFVPEQNKSLRGGRKK